ncbi:hypothetical protein ZWY2020_026182 [Hordeum vulgare]|nr:hypothetical protein ZWY2020_026182 [Hordeum vulgare]
MRLPGGASLALLLARRSLSSSPAASSRSSSIHATCANRARCVAAGMGALLEASLLLAERTRQVLPRDQASGGEGLLRRARREEGRRPGRDQEGVLRGFKPWRSCYGVEVSFEMLAKQLNIITKSATYLHQSLFTTTCRKLRIMRGSNAAGMEAQV